MALGVALGVADTRLYWYGVAIIFFGICALLFQLIRTNSKLWFKLLIGCIYVGSAALFYWMVIRVNAQLPIAITPGDGNYAVDSDQQGIKWEQGMTDLSITILNPSTSDYKNLDITFRPDVPTRKVLQVTNVFGVEVRLLQKIGDSQVANMRIQAGDNQGHVIVNGTAEIYASGEFRLFCPDLPPDSTIELYAALVNPKAPPNSTAIGKLETLAGPKKQAKTVNIDASYTVLYRPHYLHQTFKAD